MSNRINVKQILRTPEQRKKLMIQVIMALQESAGITTTWTQAEEAYEKIQQEKVLAKA